MSFANLLYSAASGFLAILMAFAICRLRVLHPGVKTWICRVVLTKMIVGLFAGAVVRVEGTSPAFVTPLLTAYLAAVWLAGAMVVLWYCARAYREAARMLYLATPCAPIAAAPGLTVRKLRSLPEPCIVGVFRPVLLVPEEPEVDALVIRHEVAHVRHFDGFFGLVAWLVYMLFWFVPGCGRLVSEHSLWQEAWADLDARNSLRVPASAQAKSLLKALSRGSDASAAILNFRGDARLASRRIEAMFSGGFSTAVAVVVVLLTLLMAMPIRVEAIEPAMQGPVSPARLRVMQR
jgi:beta-lactamase regulating signal transducer with metallopeptidase domain